MSHMLSVPVNPPMSEGRDQARQKVLSKKADNIHQHYTKLNLYLRKSVKHALIVGQYLNEAKKMAGHGHWLDWFDSANFAFSQETAQRYMRLYLKWPEIKDKIGDAGNPSTLTDLTYTDALAVLSKSKPAAGRAKPKELPIESEPKSQLLLETAAGDESATDAANLPACEPVGEHGVETQPVEQSPADQWLTPEYVANAALKALGRIDLDPASDGKNIAADRHYTASDDGLKPENAWQGHVFLNPPAGGKLLAKYAARLRREFEAANIDEAILLVPARMNEKWIRGFRQFPHLFLVRPEFGAIAGMVEPLVAIYLGKRVHAFFDGFVALGDGYLPYMSDK